jgi:hypothetical protein
MDDAPAPSTTAAPQCQWEQFCENLPQLWQQMEDLAIAQRQLGDQLALMNQRDALMARGIAELARRQGTMAADEAVMRRQMKQVLDGVSALAGTPSRFAGLAQDVRGSFNLTKRFVKWILLPLAAVAAAIVTIWGLLHITESKGETPMEQSPSLQEPPRRDG